MQPLPGSKTWKPAVVVKHQGPTGPKSYVVRSCGDNHLYRRNRRHLVTVTTGANAVPIEQPAVCSDMDTDIPMDNDTPTPCHKPAVTPVATPIPATPATLRTPPPSTPPAPPAVTTYVTRAGRTVRAPKRLDI